LRSKARPARFRFATIQPPVCFPVCFIGVFSAAPPLLQRSRDTGLPGIGDYAIAHDRIVLCTLNEWPRDRGPSDRAAEELPAWGTPGAAAAHHPGAHVVNAGVFETPSGAGTPAKAEARELAAFRCPTSADIPPVGLLTFTGFHDPYSKGLVGEEEQPGPILSLLEARSFDLVFLLSTPNTERNTAGTVAAFSRHRYTLPKPRAPGLQQSPRTNFRCISERHTWHARNSVLA
jgi:hypothetical protein